MSNPFDVVREFEAEICSYTGAPFAVCTNSCTMALFLALRWHWRNDRPYHGVRRYVTVPKRTYVSVPMQIMAAGYDVAFHDIPWTGSYMLQPFNIWDSARWFKAGIFSWHAAISSGACFVCVSFHSTKTLGLKRYVTDANTYDIEQGGAILHNDPEADRWFRRARFDGRTEGVAPKDDTFDELGWHCYMNPSSARLGLRLLRDLPRDNPPLPNDDYPDLSKAPVFRR
jgi:dTDP-4-amino-4,6-dideoxygalactose transaminase